MPGVCWLWIPSTLVIAQEDMQFGFAHPLPRWGWGITLLILSMIAWWSYHRLAGQKMVRIGLGITRFVLLLVLVFLALGPELVRTEQRIERDSIIVLLDRSKSLTIPDGHPLDQHNNTAKPISREAQLQAILKNPIWHELEHNHELQWMGFDSSAYHLNRTNTLQQHATTQQNDTLESPSKQLKIGKPMGARTRLDTAITQSLKANASHAIAGIVLVSDGRTTEHIRKQLIQQLKARKIPVVSIPLGSDQPLVDLAISRVDTPTSAFVDDVIPVSVTLSLRGKARSSPRVRVILTDTLTGETLDEQTLASDAWNNNQATVVLSSRSKVAGKAHWRVQLASSLHDILPANNTQEIHTTLSDRPLRVAYFDGYPRWEYRYIKDMLLQESSIKSSTLLLATNRRYIQEGDIGLGHVPRSEREWADLDVIVLGDLRPDVMSREQLEQLRDHVAQRGAGVVWIAGPGSTPWDWLDTPLADLLPFVSSDTQGRSGLTVLTQGCTLTRAAGSDRLGVLHMGDRLDETWLDQLSDPRAGWSVLRWAVGIEEDALKPTAQVLARVDNPDTGKSWPCVITMRYGAGRIVFVGTDEIWRWRYARGPTLGERFYLPLFRLAGRSSLSRSGQAVLLEAAPTTVQVAQPVRLSAVLLEQSLVDAAPSALNVTLQRQAMDDAPADTTQLTLGKEGIGQQAARYASNWVPTTPGNYIATLTDPLLADSNATTTFRVISPDDELRLPDADHALLTHIANQTGGLVLSGDAMESLADVLPNRSIVIQDTPEIHTLWDSPWALLIVIVLLLTEWLSRRLIRLA